MNTHNKIQPAITFDRFTLASLVIFGLTTSVIFFLFPEHLHLRGDSNGYFFPAYNWLENGKYESLLRLPGYPLMLLPFIALSANPVPLIVAFQGVLLFAMAILSRKIFQLFFGKDLIIILILTAFNPVALFFMQRILPEIFFAFLLALHLYLLITALHSKSLPFLFAAGLIVALMAISRANGLYLIPVSCMVIVILTPGIKHLLLFIAATIIFLAPFMLNNYFTKGYFSLASPFYVQYAMHENLLQLEQRATGMPPIETARKKLYAKCANYYGMTPRQWDALTRNEKIMKTGQLAKPIILSTPLLDTARAMASAEKVFLFDGGVSWWSMAFNFKQKTFSEFMHSLPDDLKSILTLQWNQLDPNFLLYTPLMAFIFFTRTSALVGVFCLVKSGKSKQTSAIILYILCIAATSAFLGNSRYRLPIDPLIFMFSAYGFQAIFTKDTHA